MAEWISEKTVDINWVLERFEKKKDDPPVLVLQVNKLYKLRLTENPRNIQGTEGYVVRVMNEANNNEYLLFLQKALALKFKEVNAKEGDVLAVINKGKNMQTGYEYMIAQWDETIDTYLDSSLKLLKGK